MTKPKTPAEAIMRLSKILQDYGTPEELAEIDKIVSTEMPIWVALPGPQTEAYESPADILYYGGAAGGSKTELLIGLALTQHHRSVIYRREGPQLQGIFDRMAEILGSRDGFNSQSMIWRLRSGRQIDFGSFPNIGDELKYSGRPHDLVGFDELPLIAESQFRFLTTWLRTTRKGQRCRVVCTGNPPTTEEGRWVVGYWGPWLDDKHPKPANPGELRWYTTIDGRDVEVEDGQPIVHGGHKLYPQSRTFIPSRVSDNPFLASTGYLATLQSLPEPLRSQMLYGDFRAGMSDSEWQVIPTDWVDKAMERWTPDGGRGKPMDSVGVDVARGGQDQTVISLRHGTWYDQARTFPGTQTPDGPTTAGLVVSVVRDSAPIHIDIIGVGGSVYDHLKSNSFQVIAVNGASSADDWATDKATGRLRFRNRRAQLWWRMREALDPKQGDNLALPNDPELRADLCSAMWKLTPGGILIEDKDEIKKRLGRSPDKGDAVVMANICTKPERRGGWRDKNWRGEDRGTWKSL